MSGWGNIKAGRSFETKFPLLIIHPRGSILRYGARAFVRKQSGPIVSCPGSNVISGFCLKVFLALA